jgi:hypothetical protein
MYQDLARLEAMPSDNSANLWRIDSLQQIDATLDALENDVHPLNPEP